MRDGNFFLEWISIGMGDHLRRSIKRTSVTLLHQAMLFIERPFCCPIDGCSSSYQRKDHLIRHMCSHQGKMFTCPLENCKRQFVFLANMKRHIAKYHAGDTSGGARKLQSHACPEVGCGKSFKFLSKLKKHQLTHVKLESVECICTEPGCGEFLSNTACLKAHIHSCHSHVMCPVCGTHQLRKNFKRHQHTHEDGRTEEKTIKCSYDGCSHMFTNKSNLNAHVKAVHLKQKPFTCGIFGCGKKFSFRHVRDNHEKCGIHICARGDFLEADLQFRSRPRGGRPKRKFEGVDMLLKKRVALPGQEHVLDNPSEYLSWVLGGNE